EQVEQDHVDPLGGQDLQRLGAVGGLEHPVPQVLDALGEGHPVDQGVVDDEDGGLFLLVLLRHTAPSRSRWSRACRVSDAARSSSCRRSSSPAVSPRLARSSMRAATPDRSVAPTLAALDFRLWACRRSASSSVPAAAWIWSTRRGISVPNSP